MRMNSWLFSFLAVHVMTACSITAVSFAQEQEHRPSPPLQWERDPAPTLEEVLPGIASGRDQSNDIAILGDENGVTNGRGQNGRVRPAPDPQNHRNRTQRIRPGKNSRSSAQSQQSNRISPWRGTLVPNPDRGNGHPPYMVVDRNEMKRRYIRPVRGIDLGRYLYQPVIVRQDTGLILSATQLDYPVYASEPMEPSDDDAGRDETDPYDDEFMDEFVEDDKDSRPLYAQEPRIHRWNHGQDLRRAQYFEELPPGGSFEPPSVELLPSDSEPLKLDEWESEFGEVPDGYDADSRQSGPLGLGLLGFRRGQFMASRDDQDPCNCGDCSELPLLWGRAEYLLWWTSGMYIPPLVTTSLTGTAQSAAGVLDQPSTTILYGNGIVMDGHYDGARFGGGVRLLPRLGVELDYFGLDDEWTRYQVTGTAGAPILGRPFFNMLTAAEDAELISFPGLVEGTATIDTNSDLESHGIGLRYGLCCQEINFGACSPKGISKIDILGGYRYMQLDEGLRIREDLTSLDQQNPGNFILQDSFRTHNDFHGGEIGAIWLWERPWWSIELLAKLAIGSTRQEVTIAGNTVISDGGFSMSSTGGLLAQRSNIGQHVRNEFSMIPELGAKLGIRVTKHLRLTGGYSLIYWSRVVQPGHHVDLDLNPNLIPPEVVPFTGPLRPAFAWNDNDYWAHGVNAGLDCRW
ncbi:MAG: BBP7 family outer membrane beta-barrel protein [Pirellulales bacterium]|nr:BBP7 family outer membrane beta-barrel protein [Pirellulales bacterium]